MKSLASFLRIKTRWILSVALISVWYHSHAQAPKEPINVQSPNVSGLGLYGEVPVSHFTGLPTIEIPLYNLGGSTAALPISLSYHASGFRADMHPGWVGAGWSLNAGGVISRSVNDMPDDYHNATWGTAVGGGNSGFFWNRTVVNPTNNSWSSASYMTSIVVGQMFRDTEPDEFSVLLPKNWTV